MNPALLFGRSGGTLNSELACGEFIKPREESRKEEVACGLKRSLVTNHIDQTKGRG